MTTTYDKDWGAKILARVLKTEANGNFNYFDMADISKVVDKAMIRIFEAKVREMPYNARVELKHNHQHGWIDGIYQDRQLKLSVTIHTDRDGYYWMNCDNILSVDNESTDTRLTIREIESTQKQLEKVASEVFELFK